MKNGTIFEFLLGTHSYDGVWFGENHPTIKGKFWWRNILRENIQINDVKDLDVKIDLDKANLDKANNRITYGVFMMVSNNQGGWDIGNCSSLIFSLKEAEKFCRVLNEVNNDSFSYYKVFKCTENKEPINPHSGEIIRANFKF